MKLFGLKRMWCRRAVCLNECPRNLFLMMKVDVLEYIGPRVGGEHLIVRGKKNVARQMKGNWGDQALAEEQVRLCQLIWYLAAHENDPSGQSNEMRPCYI